MFEIISFDSQYDRQDIPKYISYLQPKLKVMIELSNGLNLAHAILECFKNDLVCIPINPRLPVFTKNNIIQHCNPNIIITENTIKEEHKQIDIPEELSFIIYTSGSTGSPKGVMLTKDAVMNNAINIAGIHDFNAKVYHGTCLPLFHCNAIMMSLIGSFLANSKVFIQSKPNMEQYLHQLNDVKAKTASIVPPLIDRLLDLCTPWPDDLEYLITAASDLKPLLAKRFYHQYGPKLIQGYGLTEAVNFSFVMPKLKSNEFIAEYINQTPPIGKAIKGTAYKIVDEELYLHGKNNMLGYYKNIAETELVLSQDNWLKTGDLAYERNGYIVLKGRKKDVINRGGEIIYPKELEERLISYHFPYNTVVFANKNNFLDEDIAISVNSDCNITQLISTLSEKNFHYSSISFNDGIFTATQKPMRAMMKAKVISYYDNPIKYNTLLLYAKLCAQDLLKKDYIIQNDMGMYIYNNACLLDKYCNLSQGKSKCFNSPAFELIDLVKNNWDKICLDNITGENLISQQKGLWYRLMTMWPMNNYAKFMFDFLFSNNLLSGRVLEIGSGVGNTSVLVKDHIQGMYIRTDISEKLLEKYKYSKIQEVYDFDTESRWDNLNLIFGVNALHCSKNKVRAISNLYNALQNNGYLVIAEGENITANNLPWALNLGFGIFKGWYDCGGFLPRAEWLEMFKKIGFKSYGACMLRSGKHDLGGIIWGKK